MTTEGDAELVTDYEQAGFGQALGFGRRPALLVVDMVKAYLDPASPLFAGVDSALLATTVLLSAARTAGIPVLFTKVVYERGGQDGGLFFKKAQGLSLFVGESELGDLAAELERTDAELLIRKQFASAFFGTSLTDVLHGLGVDTVLIAGLSTSGCVRATAVDAVQLGFAPMVVREAVGDRSSVPHEASLFDLDAKYADVVSLESTVAYMSGLTGQPR